ncbi:MAG: archaellin/type IV pilin N-terminal domain-containing protein [Candidatus Bathycorpusculaceae bacterium]
MKILKSKKALSPVVASIILIAVTVAVSIAVAAWMGALTFTFTATEQVQITNISFGTDWVAVTVNNTGTSPVTINEAWINNVKQSTTFPELPKTVSANSGFVLNITGYPVTPGANYQVKLVSSKGNQFLYSAVAPAT